MKRITIENMEFIANKILEEVDLHFRTQKVLSEATKKQFIFWNIKEIDVLIELNHYCNLKDLIFTNEDIKKFHIIIESLNKYNYNFGLIFTNISNAIFYIKDK